MKWTAHDIPDQSGRIIVITGASSGLGFEATRALLARGATVVAGCRNLVKGRALAELGGPGIVELRRLELSDLDSVAEFAAEVGEAHGHIDVLINNAGVMAIPRTLAPSGVEMQFAVNHLGHFALTGRLLPKLLASPAARVVTVSSTAHRMGRMDLDDLSAQRSYQRWRAYGRSKLANLMFTYELERKFEIAQVSAIAVAAHPGYSATDLQVAHARAKGRRLEEIGSRLMNLVLGQSAEAGAWPELYAATAPGVRGGQFIGPDQLFESRGHPTVVQPTGAARDRDHAERLWQESVRLTGVTYDELDPDAA